MKLSPFGTNMCQHQHFIRATQAWLWKRSFFPITAKNFIIHLSLFHNKCPLLYHFNEYNLWYFEGGVVLYIDPSELGRDIIISDSRLYLLYIWMPLTSEQWKKGNKLKKGIHGINPFKVHGLSISKIYETSPFFTVIPLTQRFLRSESVTRIIYSILLCNIGHRISSSCFSAELCKLCWISIFTEAEVNELEKWTEFSPLNLANPLHPIPFLLKMTVIL